MKKINNQVSFIPMEMADLSRKIDNDIEGIQCYVCGSTMQIHHAYINKEQKHTFEMMVKQYNSLLEDIDNAIISIYGEDIRRVNLAKKMNELRRRFLKPNLKGI